jgi:hypothetical protein
VPVTGDDWADLLLLSLVDERINLQTEKVKPNPGLAHGYLQSLKD